MVRVYAVTQLVTVLTVHTGVQDRHPAYLAAQLYTESCPPAADSLP